MALININDIYGLIKINSALAFLIADIAADSIPLTLWKIPVFALFSLVSV